MPTILGVAIPFFAVLLCGMLAARLRLLDAKGLFGLNTFVFWFSLPALLFQKVAATPFDRLTDPWLYLAYEGSVLILYALVYAAARFGAGLAVAPSAMCAFVAAWGNVGYMGVPLLSAGYGEHGVLPAVLAVVLDTLILQSITILLLEADGAGKGGLGTVARAVVRNPLIIAVFAGGMVAGLGIALPLPIVGLLSLLGPAAASGALFALGATLRPSALAADKRLVSATVAAKLLLLPAIAWAGFALVPVPGDLRAPLLLTTALPTAASVFVIAQRYGVLERPVAAIVFASHLAGIVTLTLLLVLLGP
jgi:malonate transporter